MIAHEKSLGFDMKKIQLYRNNTLYTPSNGNTALQAAKSAILQREDVVDGEIVLARYQETPSSGINTLVCVYYDDGTDSGWTFLGGLKVEIEEMEEVIAQALSDLDERIEDEAERPRITGIMMNGALKGISGTVDLGTVITQHQSLDSLADGIEYDTQNDLIYLKHGNTQLPNPVDTKLFTKERYFYAITFDSQNNLVFKDEDGNTVTHAKVKSVVTDSENVVDFIDITSNNVYRTIIHPDSQGDFTAIFCDGETYTSIDFAWSSNAYTMSSYSSGSLLTSNVNETSLKTNFSVVANLNKTKSTLKSVSSSVTIDPYEMSLFGTVNGTMAITFNTAKEMSGYVKEYIMRFTAGTNCSITLPNGVLWVNGTAPTYTSGHVYEINIINNCAVAGEFY